MYSMKLPYGLTNPIKSDKGVKQSCVLSPLLINMYINDMSDIFEESCDPMMLQSFKTDVADNPILMPQTCLDNLYEYCQQWTLVVYYR